MSIPLKTIHVKADILDGIAKVSLECHFINENNYPVNLTHYFSLDCNAIINNLEITIGERMLKSTVEEKKKAENQYINAVNSGRKGSIIKKLSDNDYKLQIGNVDKFEKIKIMIEYITTLECNQNGSYIFVFPTNISAKYFQENSTSQQDKIYINEMSSLTFHQDKIYIDEMLKMTYSSQISYSYTFEICWKSANQILGIEAPSEICEINYNENEVFIVSNGFPFNGDFNIALKTEHKPAVYYYEDIKTKEIYTLMSIRVDKPEEITENRLKKDYKIIIDCSGSMKDKFNSTTKMTETTKAVIKFLNLLKKDDYFNITFFGSKFKKLFESSVKLTDESVNFATNKLLCTDANMGGTELFECLKDSIINTDNVDNAECEKIVVLFTDGQIGNYSSLTNEIFSNYNFCNDFSLASSETETETDVELKAKKLINNRFRIFTIGIGNDVDRKLIKKLAEITGGIYVCAKDSNFMKKTLEFIASNINAKYYLDAYLDDNENAINVYNSMYPNQNYIFAKKFNNIEELKNKGITLLCKNSKTNAPVKCNIKFEKIVKKNIELKQIYMNFIIKNLEHVLEFNEIDYKKSNEIINYIINISTCEKIMSKYTAFLIVDDVQTVFENSTNITIPHYISNHDLGEEIDRLDGGMSMFGGSSRTCYVGEKNFIPHKLTIEKKDILQSLNNLNEFQMFCLTCEIVCYKSFENLVKDALKSNMSPEIYYNTIVYFEMTKYSDLMNYAHKLLRSICKFCDKLTSFKMLKAKNIYNEYISVLKTENDQRTYRSYVSYSYGGGGGDY